MRFRVRGLRLMRRLSARRLRWLLFVAATIPLLLCAVQVGENVEKVVTELAVAEVGNFVTDAVNDAVAGVLASGGLDYADFVTLTTDTDGRVTAVITSMSRVNTMQAAITGAVIDELRGTRASQLGVPLGNVIGGSLLSGRGPELPIRILSVSHVDASFRNDFTDAGINQTKHEIILHVSVSTSILTPSGTTEAGSEVELTVAETIIVGDVPESYMYFESSTEWDEALEQYDILT